MAKIPSTGDKSNICTADGDEDNIFILTHAIYVMERRELLDTKFDLRDLQDTRTTQYQNNARLHTDAESMATTFWRVKVGPRENWNDLNTLSPKITI